MRYLLDTNVLVYFLAAPSELSSEARRVLEDEILLFVSKASFWEIGIKQSIGKMRLELSVPEIERQCIERDMQVLPVSSAAIERLKSLPDIHRDPFDRILIAQAQDDGLTIVTRDRLIPQYPVQTVW
ncbi:MAG: type II toxin-antitoxin system VapC family toxin [Kiritimatiellae bacterium]|nr:type II toxin-antitoxin system VapC family toxin [Kiritimatiellia bacterium]